MSDHQLEEELAAARAELATTRTNELEHVAVAIAAVSLQWHHSDAPRRWALLSEWGRERYRDDARAILKALTP